MFFDPMVTTPAYAPATQSAEISVLTYNVRGLPWPVALRRGQALRRIGRSSPACASRAASPTWC